jgi:DNA mismatch endonuclease (patch repair protein)
VDGCFWHGCPAHGRSSFVGPNAVQWQAKMTRNRKNDRKANAIGAALGWRVIRVWECVVTNEVDSIADEIALLTTSQIRLRSRRDPVARPQVVPQ